MIINEIIKASSLWRYSAYLAFVNLQQQHIKSSLGLFWEPLSSLFVASVLSVIWAQVFNVPDIKSYFLYVLSGITVWMTFLAPIVRDGAACLSANIASMQTRSLPIISYVYNHIAKATLRFLISVPLIIFFVVVMSDFKAISLIWLILSIILIIITSTGLLLFIGILVLFFGDVKEIVTSAMRLGFLSTPILWAPERLGEYSHLIWLNPFYSYLDLCRSSLLSTPINMVSLKVASLITVVVFTLGLVMLKISYAQIRYQVFKN